MLISSPIAATPPGPATFSQPSSYVDGTPGFGEELNSARDSLSAQSDSAQASTQITVTTESTNSASRNTGSTATRADGKTPDQAVPDQPFSQTPDRSLFSLAVKQSIIDTPFANKDAAPRVRGNRLSHIEDAKGSPSSRDGSKAPGAPLPTLPIATPPVVSATPVPTVPANTPTATSGPPSSGAGLLYKLTRQAPYFTDSREAALPSTEPPPEDSVPPIAVPNPTGSSVAQNMPEALAFAVRVQPAKAASLPSRISGGQTESDDSHLAGVEDTSSRAHATRQKLESDAEQGGSLADGAAPKDAGKSKADSEGPAQNFSVRDDLMPISTGTGNPGASSLAVTEPKLKGSPLSNPAARTAEPPPVSQTAPQPGPMKELSMRIEAAEGQKVDVRIVQRAGDLQIAVKSVDDITTQGLRHGLTDLANRLNETGYHAETWRPGQQAALENSTTSSENPSHHSQSDGSQSDGSQSHSGGPQQDRGQRHNNPSNRPHWIDELESNISGGAEQSGQFNGIVSQSTI